MVKFLMAAVSSIYVFLQVLYIVANAADMATCVGEKGEKGDLGHPGQTGLRGIQGEKGLTGFKGLPGEKGAAGVQGSQGPRGPQGPSGVIGSPGKPGLQGPPGNTGSEGPVGPLGNPGVKGEKGAVGVKGNLGPRGIAGADAQPGPPGHRGPPGVTGTKGEKGVNGDPGHKGERGPQGIPGPPIDKQTLKEYFDPVKASQSVVEEKLAEVNDSLRTEVYAVRKQLETLQNMPAAHLSGSGSNHGTKSHGSTITDWYTGNGSTWSPYLRGGMVYSDGVLAVPQGGLYYVYAQLYFFHTGRRQSGVFGIFVNGSERAQTYHQSNDQYHSYYMGRLLELQNGDRISVVTSSSSNYHSTISKRNYFGAFRLS